jgi:predicted amidohydrolase
MRVGYVQFNPIFGEAKRNLARIAELIANEHADLWVFPELCTTGYQFTSKEELGELAEPIPDGPSVRALVALAREKHCHLVAGIAERAGQNCYNSAVLLGPTGLLAVYRKIHLFFREKLHFTPGDRPFSVVQVNGIPVGLMICYDHMFPEAARVLALQGALVLLHPANFVIPGVGQLTMRARALENRVFVVTANRVGQEAREEPALLFTGMSQIVGPTGEILASSDKEGEEARAVDIAPEKARDKRLTPLNDLFCDRRPEFYRPLLGQ